MIPSRTVLRTRTAVSYAGAAILLAYGIARLPNPGELTFLPSTPFDHSQMHSMIPAYRLLLQASRVVPRGAAVFACHEPRNPEADTGLHRWAVALLPDRRLLPGAIWGWPTPPELERQADYTIILGRRPSPPPGNLLLETRDGSIWRRGTR